MKQNEKMDSTESKIQEIKDVRMNTSLVCVYPTSVINSHDSFVQNLRNRSKKTLLLYIEIL